MACASASWTIETAGVEITELDAQQIAAFQDAVQETYDEWRATVTDEATADEALQLVQD